MAYLHGNQTVTWPRKVKLVTQTRLEMLTAGDAI